ncbi:MAG: glycosyl hydrolase [Marinoscillum sp.]
MKNHLILFIFILAAHMSCQQQTTNQVPDWPKITSETKPWTRWWWHGSAVTKAGITRDLESLKKAGIGGVELTPIFGVIGKEEEFIDFLSPQWVDMFTHTLTEAKRLELGVDMATGTGWPFGGPWIGQENAPKTVRYKTFNLKEGETLNVPVVYTQEPMLRSVTNMVYQLYGIYKVPGEKITGSLKEPELLNKMNRIAINDIKEPISANENLQALALDQVRFEKPLPLQALVAYSDQGETVDLTDKVSENGKLDWTALAGDWTLYAVFQGWHGKMVERAAPGGEGNTIDHFSKEAIQTYLSRFDSAFSGQDISYLRAFFNDSYEVDDAQGNADWTPEIFEEFETRRGYNLKEHLPALFGKTNEETSKRVLSDYRETIGDLILERFTLEWKNWAETNGAVIRNQAHGSPGNILDLYGASGIPETEGTDPVSINLASSAAHVTGKNLASSESATWLDEHFLSTLADARANLERYLLGGINHVLYHGTAYSPADEEWPGRLFYAAVHANDRNSWWDDFAALNQYVTRVQSFMQAGESANDLLLYLPMYDLYSASEGENIVHFDLGRGAFEESNAYKTATWLKDKGYLFDFISDQQLQKVQSNDSGMQSGGLNYSAIIIPSSEYIPLKTLQRINELASQGVPVIAINNLPLSPPGLYDLENRKASFENGIRDLSAQETLEIVDFNATGLEGLRREPMVELGLEFVRRKYDDGNCYFIVNQGKEAIDGFVPLSVEARSIALYDPMTGKKGVGKTRSDQSRTEVYLQLLPEESILLVTSENEMTGASYNYYQPTDEAIDLKGPWKVKFVKGGPELPDSLVVDSLTSWTAFDGEKVKVFSGTASYSTTLSRPEGNADGWYLNLGEVQQSATVYLNNRWIGTLTGPNYRIFIDQTELLLQEENTLEIHVSNLMANRIADLDKQGVFWKKFYNVNFPARLAENRSRGLFDASGWQPRPSGLLGPVTLTPLKKM